MRRWWDERGDFGDVAEPSPLVEVGLRSARWRLQRRLKRLAMERWLDSLGPPSGWGHRGPAHLGLCYHGVAAGRGGLDYYDPSLLVSAGFLRRQLHLMTRWFECLPAGTVASRVYGARRGTLVAVTFDDGLRSVLQHAQSLLRDYDVQATLFINDSVLGGGVLWHDKAALAARTLTETRVASILAETCGVRMAPGRPAHTALRLVAALKGLDSSALFRAVDVLEDEAGVAFTERHYLNAQELRALAEAGHEVGGHTTRHLILTVLSDREREAEVAGNRDALAALLGRPQEVFAYPNGAHDARVRRMMARLGFKAAFEVEDIDGHGGALALRRRNICDDVCVDEDGRFSGALFLGWLLGPGQWLDRPTRGAR